MDTNTVASGGLAELKDIHLPAAVSIFPVAYGWYILLVVLVIALGGILWWTIRLQAKRRQINQIYALLAEIENNRVDLVAKNELLASVTIFMKRVAQLKFPAQKPQLLHGETWLAFLDTSGRTTQFGSGCGRILLNLYRRDDGSNYAELFLLVRNWLKVVL